MIEINKVYNQDCLIGMQDIDDKSIDMILTDLPYGSIRCAWDVIIPIEPLWEQYKRIIKDHCAIVLTATQPFASLLITANLDMFKYDLIWDRNRSTGFQICNIRPMPKHESILVFGRGKILYNPQKIKKDKPVFGGKVGKKQEAIPTPKYESRVIEYSYPNSILTYNRDTGLHPTQKPLELFEYLIKTYSNEGALILDSCVGSGTTAIASINTNRNFIGFENNQEYFDIANNRILERLNNE